MGELQHGHMEQVGEEVKDFLESLNDASYKIRIEN